MAERYQEWAGKLKTPSRKSGQKCWQGNKTMHVDA